MAKIRSVRMGQVMSLLKKKMEINLKIVKKKKTMHSVLCILPVYNEDKCCGLKSVTIVKSKDVKAFSYNISCQ